MLRRKESIRSEHSRRKRGVVVRGGDGHGRGALLFACSHGQTSCVNRCVLSMPLFYVSNAGAPIVFRVSGGHNLIARRTVASVKRESAKEGAGRREQKTRREHIVVRGGDLPTGVYYSDPLSPLALASPPGSSVV